MKQRTKEKDIDEKLMRRFKWEASHSDLSSQDFIGMQKLAQVNWGNESDLSSREFLNWQYLDNPAGKAIVWLAKENDNNTIVGQVVFLPMRFNFRGKEILGACAANVLIDVKFRNKGVFAILARKAVAQIKNSSIKFIYGLPNNLAFPTWIKRVGFRNLGVIPDLIYVLNFEKLLQSKFCNNILKKMLVLLGKAYYLNLMPGKDPNYNVYNLTAFDEKIDNLWKKGHLCSDSICVRRKDYLNWRYFSCPTRDYKILAVNFRGELQAYVVLRIVTDSSLKVGWIVDLFSSSTRIGSRGMGILINAAIDHFRGNGVDIVRSIVSRGSRGFCSLRKNRFLPVPKFLKKWQTEIILHPLLGEMDVAESLNNYYFTLGDNDAI
ncbi:MAG: GNAT family N-acetyltransferase [Candidatus Saganbacteria bacterium]|nr:GNAT family N-acetyltransferase [Candidatus Saganbacteria bacterium]